MACECHTEIDTMLKEHNAGLLFNLFGPFRAVVEIYKLDTKKRGKTPYMMATYCPFCGVRYEPKPAAVTFSEVDAALAAQP